jgi:hypothetical protein
MQWNYSLSAAAFVLLSGCLLTQEQMEAWSQGEDDTAAPGPDGEGGADGEDGQDGEPGQDGEDGEDGLNCWDLDGDGVADPEEDINGDGVHNALDCQGSTAGGDHGSDDTANDSGGDTGIILYPTEVYETLSLGRDHSCALDTNGFAICWGYSGYGETNPPAGPMLLVDAGEYTSCFINTDSALECRGKEHDSVSGPFTDVSVGFTTAVICVVETSGAVQCWGDDSRTGASASMSGDFKSVDTSGSLTCAIDADDQLHCWGSDAYGQATPPSSGTWSQVTTGSIHACALDTSGQLSCWGAGDEDSDYGQVTKAPSGTFIQVSAGYNHTCALRSDYTLSCWGIDNGDSNDYGQVTSMPNGTYSHVSSGMFHSCAISRTTKGQIVCWGRDDYGQSTPPSP